MYQQTPSMAWVYAHHDIARKNAKFTVKLSANCHAALGRCGEPRRSNALTVTAHFFELKLICIYSYIYSPCTCLCPMYMYTNTPNYPCQVFFAARSIAGYLHHYYQQI